MNPFPVTAAGFIMLIPARMAISPFTYRNGLKFDALGRVVISG